MDKIVNLLYLSALLILVSCADKTGQTVEMSTNDTNETVFETNKKEIEDDLLEEQTHEVFRIEKKSVVFFIVGKKEAQILAKEIGESYRWETETLLNGFVKQSESFKNILSKHGISCNLSNNKRFEVVLKKGKVFTFDRISEDQIMGTIISDGEKQPLINFGLYGNKELAELIQKFYNINNLGYIAPDSLVPNYHSDPAIDSIN